MHRDLAKPIFTQAPVPELNLRSLIFPGQRLETIAESKTLSKDAPALPEIQALGYEQLLSANKAGSDLVFAANACLAWDPNNSQRIFVRLKSGNFDHIAAIDLCSSLRPKDCALIDDKLRRRKVVVLQRPDGSWFAALNREVQIPNRYFPDAVLKTLNLKTTSDYPIRSLTFNPNVTWSSSRKAIEAVDVPVVHCSYPMLNTTKENLELGDRIQRLDYETILEVRKFGALERLPIRMGYLQELERLGFPSTQIDIKDEFSRGKKILQNCYTNYRGIVLPFIKPKPEQFALPVFAGIRALVNVPQELWAEYARIFSGQSIDQIEGSDPSFNSADITGAGEQGSSKISGKEIGECFSGPNFKCISVGPFFVYGIGKPNEKELWLVDAPIYGVALRIYTQEQHAVAYAKGGDARRAVNKITDPAFRALHLGDWKTRTVNFLIDNLK